MSVRRFVQVAVVVLLLVCAGVPVGAQTYLPNVVNAPGGSAGAALQSSSITLLADAASTVKSWNPDTNYGAAPLTVGYSHIDTDEVVQFLIHFDLSDIPTNVVVDAATLELYLDTSVGMSSVDLTTRVVAAGWSEPEVTWNNQPTTLDILLPATTVDDGAGFKQFAVDSIVALWLQGTPNYGLKVTGPVGGDMFSRTFGGRDDSFHPPQLTVTYHLPCYPLTLTHSGSGADPVATPSASPGCSAGEYLPAAAIQLAADPAEGWEVAGWSGTNDNGSTAQTNTVTMPAAPHTAGVAYVASEPVPPTRQWLFAGRVLRGPTGSRRMPVAGVQVSLWGSVTGDEAQTRLATSQTTADGSYLIGLGTGDDTIYDYLWLAVDDPNYTLEEVAPGEGAEAVAGRARFHLPAAADYMNTEFYVTPLSPHPPLVLPELLPLVNLPADKLPYSESIDPPGPPLDLSILAVEVTQAVQCLDKSSGFTTCNNNSVPLVAGKPIAIRVYIKHTGGPSCPGGAGQTFLSGVRVGLNFWSFYIPPPPPPSGIGIWSGPGTPQYFDVPCGQKLDDLANPQNSLRNGKWGAATFLIPGSATAGNNRLLFNVTVNYAETSAGPKYLESNYNNNRQMSSFINLRSPTNLNVRWLLIDYKPKAATKYPPYTGASLANATETGGAAWLMKSIYPQMVTYAQAPTLAYTGVDVREDPNKDLLYKQLPAAAAALQPAPDSIYGWLPPGALDNAGYQGIALIGGKTGYGVQFAYGMPFVLAHEIGHNRKLEHPLEEQYYYKCWPYPGDIRFRETGFEITQLQPYEPTYNELMHASNGIFLSPYSYNRLLGIPFATTWSKCTGWPTLAALGGAVTDAPEVAPVVPEVAKRAVFVVSGRIAAEGGGTLYPLYRLQSTLPTPAHNPEVNTCIQLENAARTVLARHCFEPDPADPSAPDADRGFAFVVAAAAGTTRVVLMRGETVLAERVASDHAPVVTVEPPAAQTAAVDAVTLRWSATDADGDALRYMVLYSGNNGANWWPLAVDLSATSLQVDGRFWPGGDQAVVRVLATDGFHTGAANSAMFAVADKAPLVGIAPVVTTLDPYQAVVLTGFANDPEAGVLAGDALTWSSDRAGFLGTGPQILVPGAVLEPGVHQIRLAAVDAGGKQTTAVVELFVGYRTHMPVLVR